MGILVKQYELTKRLVADVYLKIDSVRAGMGEDGKITCCCGQWIGTESRAAGEGGFKANVPFHIPDENIVCTGGTLIEAVYPAFKRHFEAMGYTVEDDLNSYGQEQEEAMLQKIQQNSIELAEQERQNEES